MTNAEWEAEIQRLDRAIKKRVDAGSIYMLDWMSRNEVASLMAMAVRRVTYAMIPGEQRRSTEGRARMDRLIHANIGHAIRSLPRLGAP